MSWRLSYFTTMAYLYKQLYLYATLFYVSYTFNFPTISNRISTSSGNFKAVREWVGKLPALNNLSEDSTGLKHRNAELQKILVVLKNFEHCFGAADSLIYFPVLHSDFKQVSKKSKHFFNFQSFFIIFPVFSKPLQPTE